MRLFVSAISLFLASLCAFYFLTGYRSAFEADQACHFQQWDAYGDNPNFGCDHDLETNKWILYEVLPSHMPAKVIKRFRY